MRFSLTQESSLSNFQAASIDQLSNELSDFLEEKTYGEDVEYLLIGIITIDAEAEHFFKVRKPKYIEFKIIKDGVGNPVEVSKNLSWDMKPDYEMLRKLDGKDLQSVIATAVLNSLKEIKLPKKVQDFDLQAFELDLKDFFRAKELIG